MENKIKKIKSVNTTRQKYEPAMQCDVKDSLRACASPRLDDASSFLCTFVQLSGPTELSSESEEEDYFGLRQNHIGEFF